MSKCWYCNNELTSGDNPKHFGICNKCYDEMFKSGDTIIRSLTDKIAELQKQLEEKERLLQYGKTEIKKLNKRITDIIERDKKLLKSQPAEIVEKIREFVDGNAYYYEEEQYAKQIIKYLDDILKEYQK